MAPRHPLTLRRRHRGESLSVVAVDVGLSCYSPGCAEEARASWDLPYDAPPDTRPAPWALEADGADVNALPALRYHPIMDQHPRGYKRD